MSRWMIGSNLIYLKRISSILLVPYLALAIGAEGLHRFSCGPHQHNLVVAGLKPTHTTVSISPLPALKGNIHDDDSCILCQWLKYAPQGLTPKEPSLFFTSEEASDNFLDVPFQTLSADKKFSRAPPCKRSANQFPI